MLWAVRALDGKVDFGQVRRMVRGHGDSRYLWRNGWLYSGTYCWLSVISAIAEVGCIGTGVPEEPAVNNTVLVGMVSGASCHPSETSFWDV
jgi:hypothetical protein